MVDRLKQAGAIVIGKPNLHEFALGGTSAVNHVGPVHNPWALDRHPGGSSGGNAVAIAADLLLRARSPFFDDVEPEVQQAVEEALQVLRDLVAEIREVDLPASPGLGISSAEIYACHAPWISESPELYQSESMSPSEKRSWERRACEEPSHATGHRTPRPWRAPSTSWAPTGRRSWMPRSACSGRGAAAPAAQGGDGRWAGPQSDLRTTSVPPTATFDTVQLITEL